MAEKMKQTPTPAPAVADGDGPIREFSITLTPEELLDAVGCYDLLLPTEVSEAYKIMIQVPQFGGRVALAFQEAARNATTPEAKSRILDAVVLPAFLVGMLVGISKPK